MPQNYPPKAAHGDLELHRRLARRSGERGFTIVELMVATVLFLIVTGSIYGLLAISRSDRFTANQRVEVLKSLRSSLNMIGRDALNAGYGYRKTGALVPDNIVGTRLGIATDYDTVNDSLVAVMTGNAINTNALQPDTTVKTDIVSFIYRDMTFNDGNALTVDRIENSSGTILLRIKSPATHANVAVGDLYLVESGEAVLANVTGKAGGTANNKLIFAENAAIGINQSYTASPLRTLITYPASMTRVRLVRYSVKNDGTLVRTIYGNNGSTFEQEQPLAYGVMNMQIKYVLEDGTVKDDPIAGTDGIAGTSDDTTPLLAQVRQVTVTLRARSTEIDPRTKKPYEVELSATFSTRNLGYDAG